MYLLILIPEIVTLWLLSRWVVQSIFTFLMLLFPSRAVAVSVVSAILFPGTIIHELSHVFTAGVLGVRSGSIELVPENIKKEEVKTGSVLIEKTDPIRRSFIGLAPLFSGFVAVTAISWFLSASISEVLAISKSSSILGHPSLYIALGCLYLGFAVSNTMFPSRIDLKGTPLVIGLILILIILTYIVGFRVALTGGALVITQKVIDALVYSLTLVVAINLVVLLIMKFNIWLMTRFLGIRLIKK